MRIFWPFDDIDLHLFGHYRDEDVVFVIQNQFMDHQRMFYHGCPSCGSKYVYDDYIGLISRINDPLICKKCGRQLETSLSDTVEENFIPGSRKHFTSIWMYVLVSRYWQKLDTFCHQNEDRHQDLLMAFFRAVLSYNASEFSGKTKFNTYFWKVIHNESCDEGRERTSSKKNPSITCEVCGEKVGKISADHLMKLSGNFAEGRDGYMGHTEFINYVEDLYEDKIENHPPKIKRSIIRKKLTSEYHHCFPDSPMEGGNLSLDDKISNSDEDLSRRDVIPCEKSDPIVLDENVVVFDDFLFLDSDIQFIIDNFPTLYDIASTNKKIHNISRKYDNFELQDATKAAVSKMADLVLDEFCDTERGYTRKFIFSDEEQNKVNQKIIYDAIDLHGQNYNINTIACFVGHDNMEKEDLKIVFRILKNEECADIAREYLEPVVSQ